MALFLEIVSFVYEKLNINYGYMFYMLHMYLYIYARTLIH